MKVKDVQNPGLIKCDCNSHMAHIMEVRPRETVHDLRSDEKKILSPLYVNEIIDISERKDVLARSPSACIFAHTNRFAPTSVHSLFNSFLIEKVQATTKLYGSYRWQQRIRVQLLRSSLVPILLSYYRYICYVPLALRYPVYRD